VFEDTLVGEFTRQARSFNDSPAMSSEETLHSLIAMLPLAADQHWLDVACGPGIVTRALAPRVARVTGVDVTPAMIELARAEAGAAGLANVEFRLGDVARLDLPDDGVDGALCRFAFHHIPVPGRVLAEMARVVRPGGWVVVSDHVSDERTDLAAWHEEIERLRDPSHWACLTPARIAGLGRHAGLAVVREERWDFAIDFEEWIGRGSGGAGSRELIEQALREAPRGHLPFRVEAGADGRRTLGLTLAAFVWRRPV
jgi:SAM-dependent methyltransferase